MNEVSRSNDMYENIWKQERVICSWDSLQQNLVRILRIHENIEENWNQNDRNDEVTSNHLSSWSNVSRF
jgi:hypothetical protein